MSRPSVFARVRALAGRTARLVLRAAVAPVLGTAPFMEAEMLRQEADELRDQVARLEGKLGEVLVELQSVADRMERNAQ